ncbi:hypothetical protein [Streptomyces sp. NPDC088794]|uniref:hypothetical protein n=1 Tax=Streptomyces sp. NPDC088794 TaxID=3365902 RepID=UPI003806D671
MKTADWPYDADQHDPLTALRIPVTGTHPGHTYTACFDRDSEARPTDTEAQQIASFIEEYQEHYFGNGRWRRIQQAKPFDMDCYTTHTLEDKWLACVQEAEGGHLEWTGERNKASGTPLLRYREKYYTAAAVAFRRRMGRDPVGQAKAECGMHQCVEPSHVEDELGRDRLREQLRYLLGKGERPARCRRDHDQAEHGRLQPNGVAYCKACHDLNRTADLNAVEVES